jgi:hypothetical protein
VLLDRIPNLHIPHLLPSNRIFLLGIRLGLSLAVLQPFQFLFKPSTCNRNHLADAILYRSARKGCKKAHIGGGFRPSAHIRIRLLGPRRESSRSQLGRVHLCAYQQRTIRTSRHSVVSTSLRDTSWDSLESRSEASGGLSIHSSRCMTLGFSASYHIIKH